MSDSNIGNTTPLYTDRLNWRCTDELDGWGTGKRRQSAWDQSKA